IQRVQVVVARVRGEGTVIGDPDRAVRVGQDRPPTCRWRARRQIHRRRALHRRARTARPVGQPVRRRRRGHLHTSRQCHRVDDRARCLHGRGGHRIRQDYGHRDHGAHCQRRDPSPLHRPTIATGGGGRQDTTISGAHGPRCTIGPTHATTTKLDRTGRRCRREDREDQQMGRPTAGAVCALLIPAALALTGCGSDDAPVARPTSTTTAPATTTPPPTTTPAAPLGAPAETPLASAPTVDPYAGQPLIDNVVWTENIDGPACWSIPPPPGVRPPSPARR